MSKKSKRTRQARLPKQLQHRPPVSSQIHPHLLNRAKLVKEQMFRGEFAEAIKTGEPLLDALPKRGAQEARAYRLRASSRVFA